MCTNKLDLYSTIQKGVLQVKLFSDWKTQHMTQHTEHIWTQISTFPQQASTWWGEKSNCVGATSMTRKKWLTLHPIAVLFSAWVHAHWNFWCNIVWQRWIFFSRPKMHHAFVVQHASLWLHHNGGSPSSMRAMEQWQTPNELIHTIWFINLDQRGSRGVSHQCFTLHCLQDD